MTRLQEGAPYSPTCFTSGGPGNCAMAAYAAWIAAKKDLAQRAPGFDRLLHHFEIQLTDVEAMLRKVDVDKQAASAVAAAWVTANQSKIQSWIG
jgi:ABC-type proline/glycine betaine transport system substrate-binding protein